MGVDRDKVTEGTTEGLPAAGWYEAPGPVPEGRENTAGARAEGLRHEIPGSAYDLILYARKNGWYHRVSWTDSGGEWRLMTLEIGRRVAPSELDRRMVPGQQLWMVNLVWEVDRGHSGRNYRAKPHLVRSGCWMKTPYDRRSKRASSLTEVSRIIADNPAPVRPNGNKRRNGN